MVLYRGRLFVCLHTGILTPFRRVLYCGDITIPQKHKNAIQGVLEGFTLCLRSVYHMRDRGKNQSDPPKIWKDRPLFLFSLLWERVKVTKVGKVGKVGKVDSRSKVESRKSKVAKVESCQSR